MANVRLALAVAVAGFMCGCGQDVTTPASDVRHPSLAAAASTQNVVSPIDLVVFVACANGGLGEEVELTGELHDLFHVTADGQGGVHVKGHDDPQGISGTELTTGVKYQGTGVTQFEFTSKVGTEETDINNFRIIGAGAGNNFLVHDNFHVTISATGDVTATHDNFSIECK